MKNSLLKRVKTGGGKEVNDGRKGEGSGNTGTSVPEGQQEGERQDALNL